MQLSCFERAAASFLFLQSILWEGDLINRAIAPGAGYPSGDKGIDKGPICPLTTYFIACCSISIRLYLEYNDNRGRYFESVEPAGRGGRAGMHCPISVFFLPVETVRVF